MRKVSVFLICAALIMTAATASFAKNPFTDNLLVNPSFEDDTFGIPGYVPGWELVAPRNNVDFPADEAREGAKAFREIQSWYGDDRPAGHLWQTVDLSPGWYLMSFSGYVKRYVLGDGFALQPDWGWVTVELTADDNVVWSKTWAADDAWHEFWWVTPCYAVVEQTAGVHLRWGTLAGVGTKTFDVALADAWDLEVAEVIPEPLSVVALGAGLATFIARRRKL